MSVVELLKQKIITGKHDTGVHEVDDRARFVQVRFPRPEFADPLPHCDNGPSGSPLKYWLEISLDRGHSWFHKAGGDIKGGNWVTHRLERVGWLNTAVPPGVRRLARIVYICRVPCRVHFELAFSDKPLPPPSDQIIGEILGRV